MPRFDTADFKDLFLWSYSWNLLSLYPFIHFVRYALEEQHAIGK